jgi:hypothetical protein
VAIGGYRLNRNIAFEIGYSDAGSPQFMAIKGPQCTAPEICVVDVELETMATTVAVVGIYPLGKIWEVYAKGGAAFWDATSKQSLASSPSDIPIESQISSNGSSFLIGVGAGVMVGEHAHLRIDAQMYEVDSKLLAVDRPAGIDQYSIEFHWRF